MFAKSYKLKSSNALKNSEKKHLAQRIQEQFPAATDEKVKELVPSKSSTICMKLVLHSGETVAVYAVDGAPVVLDTEGGLVPTVCALWKVPELVPTIVIHSPVLPKMQTGAPLYLPGVATGTGGVGFPMFARGALVAARTQDNAAAALVGRATMSSADMLLRAQGICLETIHILGDQLCRDTKFHRVERPRCGPAPPAPDGGGAPDAADGLTNDIAQLNLRPATATAGAGAPAREEWPSLGRAAAAAPAPVPVPAPALAPNEPRLIADADVQNVGDADGDDSTVTDSLPAVEEGVPADTDGLLRWCLLSLLRLEGARLALPLKVNLLYKNHILPMCPPDRTLDVKKSSYKKMSKFLEAMQQEGLLEVRELEKGVLSLVAVSPAHAAVRAHRAPAWLRARTAAAGVTPRDAGEAPDYQPPLVREMFCVTAAVAELFAGVKKGTALTPAQVRASLTEYVRTHNLSSATLKGAVTVDSLLSKVVAKQEQESIKWDALMLAVQGKMTAATELRFADGTVRLSKSRLSAVTMAVATRSGNKKVTLVSNLEAYGFSLPELSRACQLGVGAACGVTRSPAARCDQLMLQGDQTHFVAKLLIEKYGLPKRYVDGADKALNKKK